MGIRLATFQQHQLTAQDYALLCAKSVSSGIFYGCNVTIKDESTLHVTTGVGIANGRTFDVTDDDYPVELTGGGSMVGRIYVHVDLADVDTPAQILVVKGATLPALVQDTDMNESTGVWDLELATFDVDASEISNLVYTASGVSGGGGGTMLAPYYDASEAWLKDQIFQKDGVLYKCLTDIAVGAPLVVGTNVKVTDFAEETEALNQNLTLNYALSNLPQNTDINTFLQMVLEKLYPARNYVFDGAWKYTTNASTPTQTQCSNVGGFTVSDNMVFMTPPSAGATCKGTRVNSIQNNGKKIYIEGLVNGGVQNYELDATSFSSCNMYLISMKMQGGSIASGIALTDSATVKTNYNSIADFPISTYVSNSGYNITSIYIGE